MELIGAIARAVLSLGEAVVFFDFLFHVLLGFYWWVSPNFRRDTKEKEGYKKLGVYIGAWFAPVLVLFVSYLIIT
jgi:hypothetical protein